MYPFRRLQNLKTRKISLLEDCFIRLDKYHDINLYCAGGTFL